MTKEQGWRPLTRQETGWHDRLAVAHKAIFAIILEMRDAVHPRTVDLLIADTDFLLILTALNKPTGVMTKEQIAIDRTIELWTWLAETGKEWKRDWHGWQDNGGQYGRNRYSCFLCEFIGGMRDCPLCPYCQKFGRCMDLRHLKPHNPFEKWARARTPRTRKKYAKLVLAQVISLRSNML